MKFLQQIAATSLVFFICSWQFTEANAFATKIASASLELQQQHYVLNADILFQLSPIADRALHNGIPLSFEVLLKIEKNVHGLWFKTVKEISIRYQVRYMTLLNLYRLDNQMGKEIGHYSTLGSALSALGYLQNIYVAETRELPLGQSYNASLKVNFDREALPLPLRPESYFKQGWSLSSQPYRWTVHFKQQGAAQ